MVKFAMLAAQHAPTAVVKQLAEKSAAAEAGALSGVFACFVWVFCLVFFGGMCVLIGVWE